MESQRQVGIWIAYLVFLNLCPHLWKGMIIQSSLEKYLNRCWRNVRLFLFKSSTEEVKLLSHVWLFTTHGLSPWNSPGPNTGVGSLFLLQGIFPTQGLHPDLLHCSQILYQLSHKGSPLKPKCWQKYFVVIHFCQLRLTGIVGNTFSW